VGDAPLSEWPAGALPPAWLEAVERACFGDAWGGLMAGERLFALGEVAFARWRVVAAAGEAELLRIGVEPAARRAGLARRLLGASEAALRAAGIARCFLEVRADNAPARALYEACGWVAHGRRARYYPDGDDAVLYCKDDGAKP